MILSPPPPQLFIGKILPYLGVTQNLSLKVLKDLLPIRVRGISYKAQDLPPPGDVGLYQDSVPLQLTPLKRSFGLLGPYSNDSNYLNKSLRLCLFWV